MKRNGFTLIELLVVVAIIGILSTVGVVAYGKYTTSAKITATKQQHQEVRKFIKLSTTHIVVIFKITFRYISFCVLIKFSSNLLKIIVK